MDALPFSSSLACGRIPSLDAGRRSIDWCGATGFSCTATASRDVRFGGGCLRVASPVSLYARVSLARRHGTERGWKVSVRLGSTRERRRAGARVLVRYATAADPLVPPRAGRRHRPGPRRFCAWCFGDLPRGIRPRFPWAPCHARGPGVDGGGIVPQGGQSQPALFSACRWRRSISARAMHSSTAEFSQMVFFRVRASRPDLARKVIVPHREYCLQFPQHALATASEYRPGNVVVIAVQIVRRAGRVALARHRMVPVIGLYRRFQVNIQVPAFA